MHRMKSDLGFNKLRLFNKIFGIDIAKASAAYTVERDLIDSINIPTKIVKRAHHKDAVSYTHLTLPTNREV